MSEQGVYYLYKKDELFVSFPCYDDYISYYNACLLPLGLGTRYLFSKKRDASKNKYAVDVYLRLVKEPGRGDNIESI